ncbi:SH3-domain-containing protein [Mycena maculata]|uniref:SH3-domain-containing protein n=1 Tax=Mycena maculata TaxID=230809 RepID=A0AAD7NJ28_9AGAR|nr:SH3-domain-containing protein [Mycena maculata]
MVFSNLGANEKDAFFSLLDEYFASRPEIFGNSDDSTTSAATSAAHRALASNPEATSRLISAGLRQAGQGLPKSSPYATAASNPDISNAVGRMGAASLSSTAPSFPRRGAGESSISPPPTTSSIANLKTVRTIGSDVDTTSAKNMFSSIRHAGKATPPQPRVPAGLAPPPNKYGPPPARTAAAVVTPPAHEEPEEEAEEEEEAQGEWAEALYDYDSADPGDLQIRANQNVWVTERTSDDWWTGEFEGKTGLFPASYVKIL